MNVRMESSDMTIQNNFQSTATDPLDQLGADVRLRQRLEISNTTENSTLSSKRSSSKHYYQGGYAYDFVNEHQWKQHECPICLCCLRDPHQTSCGHRFCYTCILTWLNEGNTCPHDNCTIGEGDIFPDTFANREILQLLVRCPFSKEYGCTTIIQLADVESHVEQCAKTHRPTEGPSRSKAVESFTCPSCGELTDLPDIQHASTSKRHTLVCPNAEVACPLAAAGCSEKIARASLSEHIQNSTVKHVQLLWERLLKLQQMQNAQDGEVCSSEATECIGTSSSNHAETSSLNGESSDVVKTDSPQSSSTISRDPLRMSGSNLHSTQRLLKDLFHRVVALEQKNRQMEILNVTLREQIKQIKLSSIDEEDKWEILGRSCNGKFVWKIMHFEEQRQKMLQNNQYVIYSHPFYTSPFGYKMCLRGNMKTINNEAFFGLFIHMMKGDNDDIIDWPFDGKVFITVKNRDLNRLQPEHFHDTIVTSSDSVAFEQPVLYRNEVGIGHPDFIRVNALYSAGFVKYPPNDILVIKVHAICTGGDE